MPLTTITNDQKWVYIDDAGNAKDAQTHSWKRLGEGINSFSPSNNGTISTKHYINAKFATSRRNGLQKQYSFAGDRVKGDDANDYLVSKAESTGEACETSILVFETLNGTSGTGTITYANAKCYNCMIDVSNEGNIEGGQNVGIDGTIYINGDPDVGTATVTTATGAVAFSKSV